MVSAKNLANLNLARLELFTRGISSKYALNNGLNEYKFVSLSKSKTDEHFSGNITSTFVSLSCLCPKTAAIASEENEDFKNFEKDIVKGCHCIPGLILEAASIIVHSDGIVTPNLLSDLLKSPQNALDFFSSPSHSGAKEEHLRKHFNKKKWRG
jgi:hypothetical protein